MPLLLFVFVEGGLLGLQKQEIHCAPSNIRAAIPVSHKRSPGHKTAKPAVTVGCGLN